MGCPGKAMEPHLSNPLIAIACLVFGRSATDRYRLPLDPGTG